MHLRKEKKRLKSAKPQVNNIQISFTEHNTQISPRLAAQVVREYLLPMIGDQSKPQERGSLKTQFLLTDHLQNTITDLESKIQTLQE
jgi:hypothetical protein